MTPTGMNLQHLDWPFFDDAHRALAADLGLWAADAEIGRAHV